MAVLLTGGTGYVASHSAISLLQAGGPVVLFDNLCNSQREVVNRVARLAGQPITLVEGDVRDTALLRQTLESHGCTAVLHFAGLKAVGESVSRPLEYFDNNVAGTLSLVRAMDSVGVRTLVFSSSATVYGAPSYLPLDEAHPTSAVNPYGRSKLHVEEILRDVCAAHSSWRVACLRYFNPVGAHPSGLLGESPPGMPNNLMPYITKVASGELPALQVFGGDYPTPDGTGVRDYVHVMDLAEGHAAALKFLEATGGWHAINLGTGQGYSVLEILAAFEKACGRPLARAIVGRRPGDVASCYANPAKAWDLLGWRASRGLDEMCQSTWKWQQQGGLPSLPPTQP